MTISGSVTEKEAVDHVEKLIKRAKKAKRWKRKYINLLSNKEQTEHCKDCKWWRDSDGLYRRGCHAESQCPINRREVFEGNGYCYMFEPQEVEE